VKDSASNVRNRIVRQQAPDSDPEQQVPVVAPCQRHSDLMRRVQVCEDKMIEQCKSIQKLEITVARYGVIPAILSALMGIAALALSLAKALAGGGP
jgi:hypothetical protein